MANDKIDNGSPTLMITTIVVLLGVSVLGAFLFIMRSRLQEQGMIQGRGLRGQEWVRKMDELGIGPRMPALYEVVVVGAGPRADFLEQDLTKFNEKTWNEFMPLVATRDTNVGTPSHPMLQVVTLLRMPTPKHPRAHRRQPTDTTLTDSQLDLDLGLAVYSSRCSIT